MRVEKRFAVGGTKPVVVGFDLFNVFNNKAYYSVANTTIPGTGYSRGTVFVPPRRLQVFIRFKF